jgi:citrate lyase synthetase
VRKGSELKPEFAEDAKAVFETFAKKAMDTTQKTLDTEKFNGIVSSKYNKLCNKWLKENEEKYGYIYTITG